MKRRLNVKRNEDQLRQVVSSRPASSNGATGIVYKEGGKAKRRIRFAGAD